MTCLGLFILVNSCHWYPSTHVLICCWPIDLSSWSCRRTSLRVCYCWLLCRSILKSVMVAVIVIGIVVVVLGCVGLVWWLVECCGWLSVGGWNGGWIISLLICCVNKSRDLKPVNNPWKPWNPWPVPAEPLPARRGVGVRRVRVRVGPGYPRVTRGIPYFTEGASTNPKMKNVLWSSCLALMDRTKSQKSTKNILQLPWIYPVPLTSSQFFTHRK